MVANNNSTDKTKEISIKNGARVIDVKEKGYGEAIRNGIQNSNSKYIVIGDADDSYNFLEIEQFIEKLREGNDIVIGNRFGGIMGKGAMKNLHKYIGTPFLGFIINKKYKINIKDINCGLRGINKESYMKIGCKCKGMEFASEMIINSAKNKLKIVEVPINFYKDKRNKNSHLRTIRDGFRHLKVIISSI